ncbi:MAG: RDD family protein [Deltaproteobacteria bacterium]|nr:RDD family protein [Deltaproteobacteria bacterium]
MVYSGFFIRLLAAGLDGVILLLAFSFLNMVVFSGVDPTGMSQEETAAVVLQIRLFGYASLLLALVYHVVMESSKKQGTLGKMAMGIKVVDADGNRITLGSSLLRNLVKILSGLIFFIGFLLVLFMPNRQSLHDKVAGTFVVSRLKGK